MSPDTGKRFRIARNGKTNSPRGPKSRKNYPRFDGPLTAILVFPGGVCQADLFGNAESILIGPNYRVLPRTIVGVTTITVFVGERQRFGSLKSRVHDLDLFRL